MTDPYAYKGAGNEIDEDSARDYIRDGYLIGPRTVLKGRSKFTQPVLPAVSVDLNKISLIVERTLESVIGKLDGPHRTIMFSGGFDSMLIASLAQRCGAPVRAVTIQFDDFNPLTVAGAIESAVELGIPHHVIHVSAKEFLSAMEALAEITDEPVMDLDLGVVYAALKKYEQGRSGDVFISGMGSDQWFGNLALEQDPGGLAVRLDRALVDELAHQRVAETHGYQFISPFLSLPMLSLAQHVPEDMKKDKTLLRALKIAQSLPRRDTANEEQIPPLIRHILIKTYGPRAWPAPVSVPGRHERGEDKILRQIILGLWLEKKR